MGKVEGFTAVAGEGIFAYYNGKKIYSGNIKMML